MSGGRTDPPALRLAGGAADATMSAPDLWQAPGDPMFTLVLSGSGGRLLFDLDEGEAAAVLLAWWKHHRGRWQDWQTAERRRALLSLVPGCVSENNQPNSKDAPR